MPEKKDERSFWEIDQEIEGAKRIAGERALPELTAPVAGSLEEAPVNQAMAESVLAGELELPKFALVPMVRPSTGEVMEVVGEDVRGLLEQGWTIEQPEIGRSRRYAEQQEERFDNPIAAGALGLARGVTLGGSDFLIGGIGGEGAQEALKGYRDYKPKVSLGTEIFGAAASAILTGGAGALGTAARATPAGMATRLGMRAEGALLAGREGSRAARVAATAGGEAVAGGLYGAGTGLTEASLSEDPITAEHLIAEVGMGTFLGAGTGAAVGAAGAGLREGLLARRAKKKALIESAEKTQSEMIQARQAEVEAEIEILKKPQRLQADKQKLTAQKGREKELLKEKKAELKALEDEAKAWRATEKARLKREQSELKEQLRRESMSPKKREYFTPGDFGPAGGEVKAAVIPAKQILEEVKPDYTALHTHLSDLTGVSDKMRTVMKLEVDRAARQQLGIPKKIDLTDEAFEQFWRGSGDFVPEYRPAYERLSEAAKKFEDSFSVPIEGKTSRRVGAKGRKEHRPVAPSELRKIAEEDPARFVAMKEAAEELREAAEQAYPLHSWRDEIYWDPKARPSDFGEMTARRKLEDKTRSFWGKVHEDVAAGDIGSREATNKQLARLLAKRKKPLKPPKKTAAADDIPIIEQPLTYVVPDEIKASSVIGRNIDEMFKPKMVGGVTQVGQKQVTHTFARAFPDDTAKAIKRIEDELDKLPIKPAPQAEAIVGVQGQLKLTTGNLKQMHARELDLVEAIANAKSEKEIFQANRKMVSEFEKMGGSFDQKQLAVAAASYMGIEALPVEDLPGIGTELDYALKAFAIMKGFGSVGGLPEKMMGRVAKSKQTQGVADQLFQMGTEASGQAVYYQTFGKMRGRAGGLQSLAAGIGARLASRGVKGALRLGIDKGGVEAAQVVENTILRQRRAVEKINKYLRTGSKVKKAATPTALQILNALDLGEGKKKARSLQEAYKQRAEELSRAMANPGRIGEKLGAVRDVDLKLGDDAETHMRTKLEYAHKSMPRPARPMGLGQKGGYGVSDSQIAEWARVMRVVDDPLALVDALIDGSVSYTQFRSVEDTAPETFGLIRTTIIEETVNGRIELDYQKQVDLSQMVGAPLHVSMEPPRMGAAQSRHAPKEEPKQPPKRLASIKAPEPTQAQRHME